MFEDSLVEGRAKTNKSWTVMVSFGLQILLIVVGILIPLLNPELLPRTELTSFLVAPPPPPPPPPPPAPVAQPKVVKIIPRQFDAGRLMAPKEIPKEIAMIKEDELPPPSSAGVVGGVGGGVAGAGSVLGGIIGSVPSAAPPPPPPPVKPKPKPKPPQRIVVGGNVQKAKLISQPRPNYPPLAKQARIQGVVRFTAIIGKDGHIQNLTLVSGHPLLVQAAQNAVKRWVYHPTLLNGEPVEVVTQIDVNFTLSN
jgi:protein TonB